MDSAARGLAAKALVRATRQPPTLVCLGNSWIDQQVSSQDFTAKGVLTQAVARLKGRIGFPAANNFGYTGATSTTILTHLAEAQATGAKYMAVEMLINDPTTSIAFATSRDNVRALLNSNRDAGICTLIGTVPPRSDANNTSAVRAQNNRINDLLWDEMARRPRGEMFVADVASALTSRSSSTGGPISPAFNSDGVHPIDVGAYAASTPYYDLLNALLPNVSPYTAWRTKLIDRTNYPSGFMTANPSMNGTAGTAGAGVSGSIADSWTIANTTGSGTATATCSKSTGVNGGEYQRIVLGGSGGLATENIEMSLNASLTAGDTGIALADIVTSGLSNVKGIYVYGNIPGPGVYRGLNNSGVTGDVCPAAFDRTAVTQQWTAASSATATCKIVIVVKNDSGSLAGTIDVRCAGLKGVEAF